MIQHGLMDKDGSYSQLYSQSPNVSEEMIALTIVQMRISSIIVWLNDTSEYSDGSFQSDKYP